MIQKQPLPEVYDVTKPWPPLPDSVRSPMTGWAAWYEGTPEALGSHYGTGLGSTMMRPRIRASQLDGGIVGALARFWWGQPQTAGAQARSLHLPLASDIAAASADQLFGQELDLDFGISSVTKDGYSVPRESKRLLEILNDNTWQALLPEAGEVQAGTGGVYLRLAWDKEIAEVPLISSLGADQAIPEFRHGRLWACTFWEVVRREGKESRQVWRHLERHERGSIVHTLWDGSEHSLGKLAPLETFPETSVYAATQGRVDTGMPDRLTVEYIPNIRPSRRWRNVPEGANLGRADIDGTEPLLDSLDETWNSLMRDMRHGKSRLLVASSMMTNLDKPGSGATVDLDRELYESLTMAQGENATLAGMLHAQQFNIRVEEHLRIAEGLMGAIVRGAGYSGQTFGLDTGSVKTATEVDSVRDRTRLTREKKTRYWTPALERFMTTALTLDQVVFGKGDKGIEIQVVFPPEASPSLESIASSIQMLRAAEAISTETAVRLAQPDWDDPKVAEEVERIKEEKKASTQLVDSADLNPDGSPVEDQEQEPEEAPGAPSPAPGAGAGRVRA